MNSPLREVINNITARWNIRPPDAEALYEAITDNIFFQELGVRLGTSHQPIILPEIKPDRWEYLFVDIEYPLNDNGRTRKEGLLNELGREGWELVTMKAELAYFKRRCTS